MSKSKFDGATFRLNVVPENPKSMKGDEGYVQEDLIQDFDDLGFSDVKIPVLENWQLSGAKPNHCYRGMCGEKVFYCHTDESGRGVFKHAPNDAPNAVTFSCWDRDLKPVEPAYRPIDWPAVMNQAVVDVSRDGCRNAAQAMPWIADWLLMDAESGMGGDDG